MRLPQASYRIQFNPLFKFEKAGSILPYLKSLGISDIYASPVFRARKSSTHGYDIIDPNQLNPQLGTENDFDDLISQAKENGIFWIQDIVPNHMSFSGENKILIDVMEKGRMSPFYTFFDIDWDHPYESMRCRLLAPFLGKFYAEALESRELQLSYEEKGLGVKYYSHWFALYIPTYARIFSHNLDALKEKLGGGHADMLRLDELLLHLKESDAEDKDDPYEKLGKAKEGLWQLYCRNSEIKNLVDENIHIFNGKNHDAQSFNLLDDLLSNQMFRLSFWKVAAEEINYRRFFNINELICLRIEDEKVFEYMHKYILKLVDEGKISGLRIDHIDGLYDPMQYLRRLRSKAPKAYIIVEKILIEKEKLFNLWPVQGTTGYDFLNYTNGIFCLRKNQRKFNRIYAKFSGLKISYDELLCQKKRLIIGKHMAGDIDNLALFIKKASSKSRYGTDITLYGLKRALVEILSLFSVYRTYLNAENFRLADKESIINAIQRAKLISPGLFYELNFIEKFLLLESVHVYHEAEKEKLLEFVMRFQQVSGPLMAKGVEDTVFYVYNRLLSLNEVGGSPDKFGAFIREFHHYNNHKAKLWPHSLNTLNTHDTKRSDDIRARLNVLSEMPNLWEENIKQWHKTNKKHKTPVKSSPAPDKNDEYFLYQTLVGALPFNGQDYGSFLLRLEGYLIKAVREAKVHTAWVKPDSVYEKAYLDFMRKIMDFSNPEHFLEKFIPFQRKVAYFGIFNSLAQTLIKITAPGVPDFYQGSEFWNLSLVDPDNRREVDFLTRCQALAYIEAKERESLPQLVKELMESKEDGRIKLFLIYRALRSRTAHKELFQAGSYQGLDSGGKYKENIIAFARQYNDQWAITVVPRFLSLFIKEGDSPLGEAWDDTYISLPENTGFNFTNSITGENISGNRTLLLNSIMKSFPGALLISD
ncbi:MAG: malto-oligosyltrehalose synthase [Candidatus Omnitrophica bacterium]|nr:malto-oligosyltrehalose synthase [Candidatus Omnitrophota bacterium]